MDVVLYISASIALLALAFLFIYITVVLKGTTGLLGRVAGAIDTLVKEVSAVRGGLQATIENLQGIPLKVEATISNANTTIDRVNGQLSEIEEVFANVKKISGEAVRLTTDVVDMVHDTKKIVVRAIHFVDDLQQSLESPVRESAVFVSALGNGIRAFRNNLGLPSSNGQASSLKATDASSSSAPR
jgi:uncharacterized protein YoxC